MTLNIKSLGQIQEATLLIDPEDESCKQAIEWLDKLGVTYEVRDAGPRDLGYGVDVTIEGGFESLTKFSTGLKTPVLIMYYNIDDDNYRNLALLGSLEAIESGLDKLWIESSKKA